MISAVIITFNEEKNIGRCLDSLQDVVDEIVVVDSFSTDLTGTICRNRDVRFIQHAFEGYIEQKNFAMAQATHDYVLSLDADECLSDVLRHSVLEVKKALDKDAYIVLRLNNFAGKWMYHSGWNPDRNLRLWNRRKGSWGGVNPHDKVVMATGSTAGSLRGFLLHYTAESVEHHRRQMRKFADIAGQHLDKQGKKASPFLSAMRASGMFMRRYFFQLGFLDGYYGWVISSEAAKYTYRKYVRRET